MPIEIDVKLSVDLLLNAFMFSFWHQPNRHEMVYPPKISIAIAGGGIGGLSLAASLQSCPHIDVQVYEGTKVYKEVGGGLAIHPNGIRAMELLGDDVKRAYFDSAELSAKDEDEELTTDVLIAQGKNAHQMLASLGAAKVSEPLFKKVISNLNTGQKDCCSGRSPERACEARAERTTSFWEAPCKNRGEKRWEDFFTLRRRQRGFS